MKVSKKKLDEQNAWAESLGPEYDDYKEMFALDNLVDVFTGQELKTRLHQKVEEGVKGWDDPDEDYDYHEHMQSALDEGRWTDLAALAMMSWNREQPDEEISPQDLPAQPDGPETFAGAAPLSYDSEGNQVRSLEVTPESAE